MLSLSVPQRWLGANVRNRFWAKFFFLNTMFISLKIILKDNSLFKAKKNENMLWSL